MYKANSLGAIYTKYDLTEATGYLTVGTIQYIIIANFLSHDTLVRMCNIQNRLRRLEIKASTLGQG